MFKYITAGLLTGILAMSISLWFANNEITSLTRKLSDANVENALLITDKQELTDSINARNDEIDKQNTILKLKQIEIDDLMKRPPEIETVEKIKVIKEKVFTTCDDGLQLLKDYVPELKSW